ncbi:Zip-domain-containing protein [Rhizoclosmatium globosum]|uniref:Zip-domain-containing protein n=1 Tax=Rhizoclosmatium globosum TaxID=329046 RepID=A0A1Y2D2Y0_9FUNG|nr:Zip-domain-containing protein [Rhizoclosmatium globosum]|eukprot:ORY53632.1 Zip-domain-containing protein [Rhizoclosmatium globosum]
MFGIGVICATAWIHLLPDAFSQFNNLCLPSAWQKYGSNFVGVFGMTAAFAVQLIELSAVEFKKKKEARSSQLSAFSSEQNCTDIKTNEFTIQDAIPSAHSGTSAPPSECTQGIIERDSELGILLLETGIIFHSMVIGITLGVTADDSFSSLLAAVAFHQMFEGMALGCLITSLRTTTFKKLLMCLAYPLTTPVGIAIGIGLREVYNTNDGGLILTRGIFNSLSAGILFYNTYTELMSAEVSHSAQFGAFSGGFKAACFGAMYLGAAAMAVVANWA